MKYPEVVFDLPPALEHPMGRFVRSGDAIEREELVAWNGSAEDVEYALFEVLGDRSASRERIAEVDSVREFRLSEIDDASFYAYVRQETHEAEEAWRRAFAERDLVVVPPLSFDDRGVRLTVVGAGGDLEAVLADVPDGIDVTVEESGEYDRRHATIAGGLTDAQLEALETAVAMGYYGVPRTASLAAVADALGRAESTVSTHLRKAESRVLGRIVGERPSTPGPTPAAE